MHQILPLWAVRLRVIPLSRGTAAFVIFWLALQPPCYECIGRSPTGDNEGIQHQRYNTTSASRRSSVKSVAIVFPVQNPLESKSFFLALEAYNKSLLRMRKTNATRRCLRTETWYSHTSEPKAAWHWIVAYGINHSHKESLWAITERMTIRCRKFKESWLRKHPFMKKQQESWIVPDGTRCILNRLSDSQRQSLARRPTWVFCVVYSTVQPLHP